MNRTFFCLSLVLSGCAGLAPAPVAPRHPSSGAARDAQGNRFVSEVLQTSEDAVIEIRKVDPAGRLVWTRTANGGALSDPGHGLAVDRDGNLFVAWTVRAGDGLADVWVRKFDADGDVAWTATWDGPAHGADFAEAVDTSCDGTVVVSGRSYAGHGRFAPFAGRFDAAGHAAGDVGVLACASEPGVQ